MDILLRFKGFWDDSHGCWDAWRRWDMGHGMGHGTVQR